MAGQFLISPALASFASGSNKWALSTLPWTTSRQTFGARRDGSSSCEPDRATVLEHRLFGGLAFAAADRECPRELLPVQNDRCGMLGLCNLFGSQAALVAGTRSFRLVGHSSSNKSGGVYRCHCSRVADSLCGHPFGFECTSSEDLVTTPSRGPRKEEKTRIFELQDSLIEAGERLFRFAGPPRNRSRYLPGACPRKRNSHPFQFPAILSSLINLVGSQRTTSPQEMHVDPDEFHVQQHGAIHTGPLALHFSQGLGSAAFIE